MHIPSLIRIPKPAPVYIVVTNRMHTRFFRVEDESIDEVETLDSFAYPLDDKEKYSIQTPSGMHAGGEDENIKQRAGEAHFHAIAARLHSLLQHHRFERLVLIVPQEYHHALTRHLAPDVSERILAVVPKEMTHAHPLEVAEAAFSAVGT